MTKSGIDKNNFDLTVSPKDDLFQFVNGGWLKTNPIPPEETHWGSFAVLSRECEAALRQILEELQSKTFTFGSLEQKLADFYKMGMDEAGLNQAGLTALNKELSKIAAITNFQDLAVVIAGLHQLGAYPLWCVSVHSDLKNSDLNILYLDQDGLSLPDRDYYLKPDSHSQVIRDKFREYVISVSEMLGETQDGAAKAADLIIRLETSLAEVSMTRSELRDMEKQYNPMTLAAFESMVPKLDWQLYLKTLGLPEITNLIIGQPLFFKTVGQLLEETSLDQWKIYLRWHLVNRSIKFLSDQLVDLNFGFYGTVLTGQMENKPRWRRVGATVNDLLPELLGQLYVEKYFSQEAKDKINYLVNHLFSAYRKRIIALEWMTEATKQKALEKLAAMERQLGYPDKWRDYSALTIKPDSYLQNVFRANQFESHRNIAKYGQPVDRSEWYMSPQTVNAYASFTTNQIVFPAAIMQPPFFDPEACDALNFGAIGSVIGHEITHPFDDKGSKFDFRGNLNQWWADEDKANFDSKTRVVTTQFDECVVLADLHVNGQLTLGENIADLGGLSIAYEAFQEFLAENQKPSEIDGFTQEQLFFFGWARVWCNHVRDEEQRRRITIDPHSPSRFRCNVPPSNMPEFYKAFGVMEGDGMYRPPEKRAKVW